MYESTKLRLGYASLVTPKQVLDYEVATGAVTVLKQQEVLNNDANQPTNQPTNLYDPITIHCVIVPSFSPFLINITLGAQL
jgi:hypothetical protein